MLDNSGDRAALEARGGPAVGLAAWRPRRRERPGARLSRSHPPGTIEGPCPNSRSSPRSSPAGDQPAAIAALADGVRARRPLPDPARHHRVGQDRDHRLDDRAGPAARRSSSSPTSRWPPSSPSELRELFPKNRVEYFVSYYDYYQPEAYLPTTDTYIEKDSSINDEIDRLRHATTSSPAACGATSSWWPRSRASTAWARPRSTATGSSALRRGRAARPAGPAAPAGRPAVRPQRRQPRPRAPSGSGATPSRSTPPTRSRRVRIELFGDTVERIVPFDVLTGEMGEELEELVVFAATHYVTGDETIQRAIGGDRGRAAGAARRSFEPEGKLLEAQRLRMRTEHDLEMLAEIGVCSGIENYSRHLDGRAPGETPYTLLDFFPKDYLLRDRREPRGRPAAARPVRRRPLPQGGARRARLPPALGHGQPAAALRRVHRAGAPVRLLVGHPGALRARALDPGGRAGHPADRPGRPRGRRSSRPRARSTTCIARIDDDGRPRAAGCW